MSNHSPKSNPVHPIDKRSPPRDSRENHNSEPSGMSALDGADRPGAEQLRDIVLHSIGVLRRRRRAFWTVFIGMGVLLSTVILIQTPLYESTSLMLVKFGRELVYRPEIGAERSFVSQDKAAVINSELAILRSQPVLEGVVNEIGLTVLYPSLAEALEEARAARTDSSKPSSAETLLIAEAAERLRLSLSSQALPEADVLRVSYQHPDPTVAAKTVNVLVDRFLDAHLRAFSEPEAVQFLTGRVAAYEARLADSETALRILETEHPAFALENPSAVLVQQRNETRAMLTAADNQMASIRLRHLQEDASVAQARNQLLTLEVEASRLQGRLEQETRQQIAVVKRFIAQRKAEVETELDALDARREAVREDLAVIEAELAEMPKVSAEHRRLVRERDDDEDEYRTYNKRLRDARLSTAMDQERLASINVIQPASPAPRPIWPPSKPASVTIALALALVAAVLLVSLLDRIGPTGIAWLDERDDRKMTG